MDIEGIPIAMKEFGKHTVDTGPNPFPPPHSTSFGPEGDPFGWRKRHDQGGESGNNSGGGFHEGQERSEEEPIERWTFRRVQKDILRLEKETANIEEDTLDANSADDQEIIAKFKTLDRLKTRRTTLVDEVRDAGGFDDIDGNLADLRLMMDDGSLTAAHIASDRRAAVEQDKIEDSESEYAGVRRYYYETNLSVLSTEYMARRGETQRETEDRRAAQEAEVERRHREALGRVEEALRQQAEAAERQSKTFSGEDTLDLSNLTEDEQRAFVRKILDTIENLSRDCFDWSISASVKKLETSLASMKESVREEVRARLALHDSSELIKQAGGWIQRPEGNPGHTIASAAAEALRRGHSLERDTIRIFMETDPAKKLSGLDTARAWDLLQDANFRYEAILEEINMEMLKSEMEARGVSNSDILRTFSLLQKVKFDEKMLRENKDADKRDILTPSEKAELAGRLTDYSIKFHSTNGLVPRDDEKENGKVPASFFSDSSGERRNAVRQRIIRMLNAEGVDGTKSLQLAEKLSIATLETSVFNRTSMTGNDQLAETIGLKGYRKGRSDTGRNRGPLIHEGAIAGFGKSWLRNERKTKDNVEEPLLASEINIEGIKEGGWSYYCTVVVGRYHSLRELLLDRKPKAGSIDLNALQSAVVYFNTADKPKDEEKCGEAMLRVWWLAGVVDMALTNIDLEWGVDEFEKLRMAASVLPLSSDAGTFITRAQWDWIMKATNYRGRIGALNTERKLRMALKKAFS